MEQIALLLLRRFCLQNPRVGNGIPSAVVLGRWASGEVIGSVRALLAQADYHQYTEGSWE